MSSAGPTFEYFDIILSKLIYDTIYIGTDSNDHDICKEIINKYPNVIMYNHDNIETIQFGSTCKNVILTQGSFSAVIGYLSFYSNIYYPEYTEKKWHGDMFSLPQWNKIEYLKKNQ